MHMLHATESTLSYEAVGASCYDDRMKLKQTMMRTMWNWDRTALVIIATAAACRARVEHDSLTLLDVATFT